jgi:hypothetical protein
LCSALSLVASTNNHKTRRRTSRLKNSASSRTKTRTNNQTERTQNEHSRKPPLLHDRLHRLHLLYLVTPSSHSPLFHFVHILHILHTIHEQHRPFENIVVSTKFASLLLPRLHHLLRCDDCDHCLSLLHLVSDLLCAPASCERRLTQYSASTVTPSSYYLPYRHPSSSSSKQRISTTTPTITVAITPRQSPTQRLSHLHRQLRQRPRCQQCPSSGHHCPLQPVTPRQRLRRLHNY